MFVVFPVIFVTDTKIVFRYDLVASLRKMPLIDVLKLQKITKTAANIESVFKKNIFLHLNDVNSNHMAIFFHCMKSTQIRSFFLYSYSYWIQENTDQEKLRPWILLTQRFLTL